MTRPLSLVVAGGGTAGHVEPALALADAFVRHHPGARVTALGTAQGLEARLVPARGYELAEIPRVPLPRRLTADLLRVPTRVLAAVRAARAHLDRVDADVVVGFGGYVALPAYLAARRRGTPFVVHEANARPGLANRVGARMTPWVAAAGEGTGLKNARVLGIPLRQAIVELDRSAAREAARRDLGLGEGPVLLVFGGSQGARRINDAVVGAAPELAAAGVQVLHAAGRDAAAAVAAAVAGLPTHQVVPYLERMDQAYAAADLVLCRAGAMTVAEVTAVGLPAVYVPLPIGNGEQALNARPVVTAGGGLLVDDAALTPDEVRRTLLPLALDAERLEAMSRAAAAQQPVRSDDALVALVDEALAGSAR